MKSERRMNGKIRYQHEEDEEEEGRRVRIVHTAVQLVLEEQ